MSEKFTGFPPSAIQFLRTLRENNSKAWFDLHKPDYQNDLLKPLQALAAGLGPLMLSIDPDLEVTPAINRTISRIYRDTRFSRDKSPYKTSHWITFKRLRQEWKDYPAFFFEISPDSYRYGMGFYSASRQTMDNFRTAVDMNPKKFLTAISFYSNNKIFTIEGEQYKRPLKADISMELQAWYNRKSVYLVSNHQIDGNFIDKKLIKELQYGFEMLAPFYHYLCKVAG
ncbi:protein of unknown function DUF2461 [Geotalea daltonii FRC-32]|uniref:TIGR02453 family protein n=1 Tax=Geotalea daltonii (strain DSM 22248 / JCM 15807 / FRC-32) TaxID=316067 RepID=B9M9J7_GEODF|nr:DUF2461 domain-containing protein [Geotalea daltonii]ACM20569.1 protein of unknown function DUF2461 [Geotalea daltonii FRC-32]